MTTEERILKLEKELAELKAEITKKNEVESAYIPKKGDSYTCILSNGFIGSYRNNDRNDLCNIEMNNVFPVNIYTDKHLEWYRDNVLKVQNKLMQLHELLCPDYFPMWDNEDQSKYSIYMNMYNGVRKWSYSCTNMAKEGIVYFDKQSAMTACIILNEEKFMID